MDNIPKIKLRLFITGQTPRSLRALANLRRISEEQFGARYQIVVVDVLEHPEWAEQEKILATPTLIKELPPPIRRVIGDLIDTEKVLLALELEP
jgi:circadian clock protein KaiB